MEEVCALTLWHMYDFNGQTKENKLRRFFVQHYPLLEKLLLVKQADFSGCADDTATAPTVERWTRLLAKMKKEGAPMTLKQLKIGGKDLLERIPAPTISRVLEELLLHAACFPKDNERETLLRLVPHALQTARR